jgi:8-amino-7-oxononanoate synthase
MPNGLIDFSSNDYLGFASSHWSDFHLETLSTGATGSRLISGNYIGYEDAEQQIASFHQTEAALVFNSGYDANLGLLSSVPQRNDVVLYDALSHASIRDGIRLSLAKAYKFEHNDLEDLEQLLVKHQGNTIYVVTETVFSMDGDSPALIRLVALCEKFGAFLIVDEAHAVGIFGKRGEGLVQDFQLEKRVFARVVTFGKALGCHGAAVLGSNKLRDYLINFARSLIYTTALPPHSVATIASAYQRLESSSIALTILRDNILHFSREQIRLGLAPLFVGGKSAIASAIIPGNSNVCQIAAALQFAGFDVRPILSPTVPEGQERLRFCLHSFNTPDQITVVLETLAELVF